MLADSLKRLVVAAVSAAALTACVVEPQPTYAYAYAGVPANIYLYPYTVYDGRIVYFYGGRSYFQSEGRWVYYTREPPALYHQRAYVQSAPPAYGRRYYAPPAYAPRPGYAPPAMRAPSPGVRSAPPATRVR